MATKKKTGSQKAGGKTAHKPAAQRGNGSNEVHQVKVTLLDTNPPIWRRFAVPSNMTLEKLHWVIQIVMGWEEGHLHQFITEDEHFYGPHFEGMDADWAKEVRDESRARLFEVAGSPKSRFVYEYDFGDGWQHGLDIEKISPALPGIHYPTCLEGERACPPEDCGGAAGYYEFLEAITDAEHPRHNELLEWIGGEFDPDAFDIDEVNQILVEIK
jgi:hypothetical protein